MSIPVLPSWGSDSNANNYNNTYFSGFVDVSNGDINNRTGNLNLVSGNLNLVSGNLNLLSGSIVAGSKSLNTATLGYCSTLTSNAQTQLTTLNNTVTGINNTLTGITYNNPTTSITNLTITGTTTLSGPNFFAGFTVTGNMSSNSKVITQAQFGYLSGCKINIQTKFDNLDTSITSLSTNTYGISYGDISYNGNVIATGSKILYPLEINSSVILRGSIYLDNTNHNLIYVDELACLSGATTNIQTKFDNLDSSINSLSTTLTVNSLKITSPLNLPQAYNYAGLGVDMTQLGCVVTTIFSDKNNLVPTNNANLGSYTVNNNGVYLITWKVTVTKSNNVVYGASLQGSISTSTTAHDYTSSVFLGNQTIDSNKITIVGTYTVIVKSAPVKYNIIFTQTQDSTSYNINIVGGLSFIQIVRIG
jgi:hypothetical protein